MRGFDRAAVLLLGVGASRIAEVTGCSQNADCVCLDQICVDSTTGEEFPSLACPSSFQCYCDHSSGEAPTCNYSRSPPDDPTSSPTDPPTTSGPTASPSLGPTKPPKTPLPTASPTRPPKPPKTPLPTGGPTQAPTSGPSRSPTRSPVTPPPTRPPTGAPTSRPSASPSRSPSGPPSRAPTESPSGSPTGAPATSDPTASPSGSPAAEIEDPSCGGCQSNDRECCGWGVWNVWTCQCDCAEGFCLSSNQKCYDGCTTRTDFNPFGGCEPGYDCPWYPDPTGATHCVSTVNAAGIYNLHRSSELCCEMHFAYVDVESCVQSSEGSVENAKDETTERAGRPEKFYPDLHGRDNCVSGNGYYDWMMDSYSESYLFDSDADCCSLWYPARTNCPDLSDPTERDVDERPYPVTGYFYPHESEANCRFGRNYPQFMAQELYVGDYLFTTPDECCSKWYPALGSACPLGPDDGVQEGRYWRSDVYFYPDWDGRWCNVGNDYPEWMADPVNEETHLFDTGSECCEAWYPEDVFECEANVVATHDGAPVDGGEEEGPSEWWPTLAWPYDCTGEGDPPSWMMLQGYQQYYIFDSKAACCKAHYCSSTTS